MDRDAIKKALEGCICMDTPKCNQCYTGGPGFGIACRDMLMRDALALINEQEGNRWISVTERLPKSMANKVIVYLQHEDLVPYIGYGHYEKFQGEEMWYDLENNEQFSKRGYTVTHWMQMPNSPQGEKLIHS